MIEVFQKNSATIYFAFSGVDNTPLNLSGYGLYYIAKQNYNQSTGEAPINIYSDTYDDAAAGTMHITLTTGDTNICPGIYLADITLVSGSNVSSYHTDGLSILANTFA